ncbi:hypothetical protein M409DRAFT_48609 [Zasmidium cellare ATCC 36951]|uniref:Uncharacterized protein n=1 Tax=Zasmidium cellare ATCC 36951 TaxID=1080233 RepID=A0A6A6D7P6_ZASCE|nr:uncharacterized protein M409DRAFT_48609 [Zasmidium cellare ATCC 36951]KAF2173666.1 hypothetical protein M409DRAFT_48609 [Zasmidium cellare ATCC 36951]
MQDNRVRHGPSAVPPEPSKHQEDNPENQHSTETIRRDSGSSDVNLETEQHAEAATSSALPLPPATEQARSLKSSDSNLSSIASSIKSGSPPKPVVTPDTPASGLQTPAACRPLTRRRATHGNQYRPASSLSQQEPDSKVSHRRSRSHDTMMRLQELREGLPDPRPDITPASPEMTTTQPDISSRPVQPPRRISQKVAQDTRQLRKELEQLRQGLSNEDAARQRELVAVNFAVNRILEMQNSQMQVQDSLIDRFVAMDLELKKNGRAAGSGSSKYGSLLSSNRQGDKRSQGDSRSPRKQEEKGHTEENKQEKSSDKRSEGGSPKATESKQCKQQ